MQPSVKAGTFRNYNDIVKHRLVPHLGDIRLTDVRRADISRCYTELRKNGRRDSNGGLSETSIEHTHRALHAAMAHAAGSRLIARNVADDVIKPKRGHIEMHVWTPEQMKGWLRSVKDHRLYPLWLTAATTGARRGELLSLRWDDIDLDSGQLAILRARVAVGYQVHETTPKSGRARTVALDPRTIAVLKDWRQIQRKERMAVGEGRVDGPYVSTREDGAPLHPHHVADARDASVRRAKVPTIRFHDLRRVVNPLLSRQRHRRAGSEEPALTCVLWWRGEDLNLRPSGYEPDELPDCSTPRRKGHPTWTAGPPPRSAGSGTTARPERIYSVCAVGGGGGGDDGSAALGGAGGAGAAGPSPAGVAVGAAAADSGASVIWPFSDSCACSEVTSRSISPSVLGVERPVLVA